LSDPAASSPGGLTAEDLRLRIRARRDELRLSQKALARRLGVSHQQLQKYESGTDRISASMLVKLARELDCRASELVGEGLAGLGSEALARHLEQPETAELLELYAGLPSPQLRRRLIDLVGELQACR
jgi:transcriptional regulator with XRE-family HTH domain